MHRIGLIAEKLAQGNIWFYNLYVFLISLFFSVFLYIIVGTTLIFSFVILSYMGQEIMPKNMQEEWTPVFSICMTTLTIIIGVFNMVALVRNLRLSLRTEQSTDQTI